MSPVETLEAPQETDVNNSNSQSCKCGIPNCPGHEIVDGHVILQNHPASKDA